MIFLTRITGTEFVLNADLIERIERTPDSVVTLIDGKKYVVRESLDEIVAAVRAFRHSLADDAVSPVRATVARRNGLHSVRDSIEEN